LELGATGLETDAWVTADGVVVLDHDGLVRRGMRRRPISGVRCDELPSGMPTLEDLYAECGTGYELSVDIRDAGAGPAVVELARATDPGAPKRLWLMHRDWRQLAEWRQRFPDVRLGNSTRLRDVREGAERRAAQLAAAGVDAVNLHYTEWTLGLTTLFHRFDRLCFSWDAQHERVLRELVAMAIDAVYSDSVERMVAVLGLVPGAGP
jgi:glycerophosphoryl diester phosphodiesterase